MIGFIITGHGTYAPGMHGAMEMILWYTRKSKSYSLFTRHDIRRISR